ncbi:hypothetical protein FHG87_013731 [Trinorchestia longiramus]|nr:hypothetical protein FHG87_013731 [Trinorchestia longiramus]
MNSFTRIFARQELLRNAAEEEKRKTEAALAEAAESTKHKSRVRVSSVSSTEKRLSFSGVDEWEEGGSSGDRVSPMPPRSPGHRGSDSDGSDVAAVQETRKFLVGEQTGRGYSRVDTSATVVGRQREAMYERVTAKLQVMRKNSIRFSRGIDVHVSRMIATAQRQVTPRSLMSLVLSIVKFFILAPFKVIMWVVGAKHLSRRSRSMRQESLRRRKAAVAAAAGLTPPLGPAVFKEAGEVTPDLAHVRSVDDESKERVSPTKVGGRDSGISEDIPDFSEDSNGSTTSSVGKTNESNPNLFSKSDKYMYISSTSTISEEPDEDTAKEGNSITTPPPSPVKSISTLPRMRTKLRSNDAKFSTPPSLAISEPDLTSILVTKAANRRSLPDQFSSSGSKNTKKRVFIS